MEFRRERVAVREAFGDGRSSSLPFRKMEGTGDEHPPIPAPAVVVEKGSQSERGVAERRGGTRNLRILPFFRPPPPFWNIEGSGDEYPPIPAPEFDVEEDSGRKGDKVEFQREGWLYNKSSEPPPPPPPSPEY